MITLKAQARDVKVNPKSIRRNGDIPAIYYGFGKTATAITVSAAEFKKAYAQSGETTIISLETPSGKLDALVHEVAVDVVTSEPIHVDFYITAKDHKLEVSVPLEFTGVAPAEKLGGVVTKVMYELNIEALPAQLPQHIVVDLSTLVELDQHITVADIKLPAGVKALVPGTEIVALAQLPHEEVESAPADLSSIEVAKKGKKEEPAEEPAK